jgi:hypothetical protein
MSTAMRNQETLWNYLWHYISNPNPDAKATDSTRIPRSTKRVHKKTKKLPVRLSENGVHVNWVSSIQLCMWDNISGPRVEQVWIASEEVKEDLQLYAARHTLCGVLTQSDMDTQIESKFHVNAEQGYMITSSIFSAPYVGATNKFSLCLIVKHSLINMYLTIHNIIVDRMTQLVYKLKAMLDKVYILFHHLPSHYHFFPTHDIRY